jgi:methyltransferase (TIGR00027 family)
VRQPSKTSILVAAARALGARERDPKVRNPDWLAERLVGPEERALLGPFAGLIDGSSEQADKNTEVPIARLLIPRTHFIDARLEAAVAGGIAQLVILGAGFDTRAYRFSEMLKDVRVFEVDHPDTQHLKIRRIREAIGDRPSNISYVGVDLRTDEVGDVLTHAGYRGDLKTFFIWEGVTMYLAAEAVHATLRWIASNAPPESAIVFDYTYETPIKLIRDFDPDKLPEPAKQSAMRFRSFMSGEPWIFGLPDKAEKEFLNSLGLELRTVLGMNSREAVEKYLTRADGTIFGMYPATEQQGYLILEAVVP